MEAKHLQCTHHPNDVDAFSTCITHHKGKGRGNTNTCGNGDCVCRSNGFVRKLGHQRPMHIHLPQTGGLDLVMQFLRPIATCSDAEHGMILLQRFWERRESMPLVFRYPWTHDVDIGCWCSVLPRRWILKVHSNPILPVKRSK